MRIAVTDASIFIDLIDIGWMERLPRLGFAIITTYDVVAELYDEQQAVLAGLVADQGLEVHGVPEEELSAWRQKVSAASRLSRPDLTVLWLAVRMGAVVLTGDRLMRSTSEGLKLEVHGLLWLFDQFLENGLATRVEAVSCLRLVMESNPRLPVAECKARLEKWGRKP